MSEVIKDVMMPDDVATFNKELEHFSTHVRNLAIIKPIALYGAGSFGQIILADFQERGAKIDFFIDSDWQNFPSTICGVKIISPQEAIALDCVVFVSSTYYSDIIDEHKDNFSLICHAYIGCWAMFNKMDSISKFHTQLADEVSASTLRDLLQYFMGNRPSPTVSDYGIYIHPEMTIPAIPNIVDGGAFEGETALYFLTHVYGKSNIFAFEPGEAQYKTLVNVTKPYAHITQVNAGLWHESTSLSFSSDGDGSGGHISSNGDITINVVAMDDFSPKLEPDLVKLDIEGAESNALQGGKDTIRQFKPNMAICLYHSWQDWLILPQMLTDLLPNHTVCFGHHGLRYYDSVIYMLRP